MADEYIAKDYDGGAQATTLTSAFTVGGSTLAVANGSSFPDGSGGPFVVVVDRGLASEEKFLIDTTTGTNGITFNIQQAGYDGTTAVNHNSGASVEHCLDAYSIKQANRYVNLQTSKGDLVGHTGSTTSRVPVGSNGVPLVANSSASLGIEWTQINTAGIADGSITAAKLASDSVTTAKIVDLNVTTGKIADTAVTAGKIASDAVTTAKILDSNVTTAKIADSNVTTAKIADSAVTSAKIADGTIVNADVNASAAIAYSKLAGVYTNAGSTNPVVTISTSSPTGGAAGDIWFKYS